MFSPQTIGIIAVVIALVSYIPYIRDILKGTTKPHPVSWITFALLMSLTFWAQIETGAGAGSWVTGVSAVAVFAIAVFSIIHGGVEVVFFDWVCFIGALFGIAIRLATHDPLTAVVVVTATQTIATIPMFRKAYLKPYEETISLFILSIGKFVVGFFAFTSFSITTVLFPSVVIVVNTILVAMLVYRRNALGRH